ncbi:MAG TPA: hypothetical protein VMW27_11595 [Thermoanaerobaculia bacterium]|nr:hypothetical protein [Thermoanaerobaculia bacterium]
MRKSKLSVILILAVFILGAAAAWAATAAFTPPPEPGTIFAVINANRGPGATTTTISLDWGAFHRSVIRGNGYGSCAGRVSGWVLMVRNNAGSTRPFTLSTSGTVVRAPYQGGVPPEISHSCYKLEKITARP